MSEFKLKELEKEIADLKETLKAKEEELLREKRQVAKTGACPYSEMLSTDEIVRYSRQMIMPQLTIKGQTTLKSSRVLVVGAGGLGCPAALYLAAAGVGFIGICDYDSVELSNLHRQILHFEDNIGNTKVSSACNKLLRLNSNIEVKPFFCQLDSSSAVDLLIKYKFDLVLDCTDNVVTRYLLNDVCVLHRIPLVSGSALQNEGQLTIYNHCGGACYRCLFPTPPPPSAVTNCGDGGVLGPVVGVIGSLQALEAIKILTGQPGILSGRLLLFDGSDCTFRNVKLRPKNPNCKVCSPNSQLDTISGDYELFCNSKANDKVVNIDVLNPEEHINAKEFMRCYETTKVCVVLDVRPKLEFEMCRVPNTMNVPFTEMEASGRWVDEFKIQELIDRAYKTSDKTIYLLCRRGNDSQRALKILRHTFKESGVKFKNVKGGLHAFAKSIDKNFPVY